MKLSHLASENLKFMVESYSESHNKMFSFNAFKALHPELDNDFISDSLYLLQHDGLVKVFPADNVAYITELKPNAIREIEDDTLLKKGYVLLKEIRSLL